MVYPRRERKRRGRDTSSPLASPVERVRGIYRGEVEIFYFAHGGGKGKERGTISSFGERKAGKWVSLSARGRGGFFYGTEEGEKRGEVARGFLEGGRVSPFFRLEKGGGIDLSL